MSIHLVVVQGRPEGQEIALPMPEFLIGRDPQCNLCPTSEAVSRVHCKIIQRGGSVYVRDLGSTNGTLVNGERIHAELEVFDGDRLQVGSLVFAFKIQSRTGSLGEPESPVPADAERDLMPLGSKTPTTVLKLKPKPTRLADLETKVGDETT